MHVSRPDCYGCATWDITPGQLSKVNFAYILMVCKALNIQRRFRGEDGSWSSISYWEVLRATGLEDLQVKIDTRTLKFAGLVARMGPDRNPNRLLFNNAAPTGSRSYIHSYRRRSSDSGRNCRQLASYSADQELLE